YNDDQSVKDTVRVGRLPGTFHQKATPQLITFEKHCDGDIYALLPTSKEIVQDTAEVKVKATNSPSNADAVEQHNPESIRQMLAFADCDKRNNYDTWVGYIKLLFDGSINWTKQPSDRWLMETALDYCNGNLKRQYVDPNYVGPSTFKPNKTPGELIH